MATFRLLFSYREKFLCSDEIKQRGYLDAVIEVNTKDYYKVVFYTFDEIDYVKKSGGYCFAEAGMILVSELSKEIMLRALNELYDRSTFFNDSKLWPAETYENYREANLD